jgi:hypothetical protein
MQLKSKPKIIDAAVTYRGGKAVSLLTLELDPRDVAGIASGCEVTATLTCHHEMAKQLDDAERAEEEAAERAAAKLAAEQPPAPAPAVETK